MIIFIPVTFDSIYFKIVVVIPIKKWPDFDPLHKRLDQRACWSCFAKAVKWSLYCTPLSCFALEYVINTRVDHILICSHRNSPAQWYLFFWSLKVSTKCPCISLFATIMLNSFIFLNLLFPNLVWNVQNLELLIVWKIIMLHMVTPFGFITYKL